MTYILLGVGKAATGLPVADFKQFVHDLDWHGQRISADLIEEAIAKVPSPSPGKIDVIQTPHFAPDSGSSDDRFVLLAGVGR